MLSEAAPAVVKPHSAGKTIAWTMFGTSLAGGIYLVRAIFLPTSAGCVVVCSSGILMMVPLFFLSAVAAGEKHYTHISTPRCLVLHLLTYYTPTAPFMGGNNN
jgi:hypothetical protein